MDKNLGAINLFHTIYMLHIMLWNEASHFCMHGLCVYYRTYINIWA